MDVAAFRGTRAHGYVSQLGIPPPTAHGLGVSASNAGISRASLR